MTSCTASWVHGQCFFHQGWDELRVLLEGRPLQVLLQPGLDLEDRTSEYPARIGFRTTRCEEIRTEKETATGLATLFGLYPILNYSDI